MSGVTNLTALAPGFDDPVFDSQSVFRSILDAMSRPGRVTSVAPCPAAPTPLMPATAAALLCLADMDTPIWLDAALQIPTVMEYLAFHCGTPIVEASGEAKFAVVADPMDMPALSAFNLGDDLYPDHSTTILLAVAGFGSGVRFNLSGPGIETQVKLAVDGLPGWFPTAWTNNHKAYPTGIDVLLCAGETIVALPRSTALELAPCM